MAAPVFSASINRASTVAAGRYLSGRIALARIQAVRRSQTVAIRFTWDGADASFRTYADGNGNGVRNADIASGIDTPIDSTLTLSSQFSGVVIGTQDNDDPIRLGSSNLLSFTPLGTATPGTIYVRGESMQLAIRIFGATGRTRLLRYDASTGDWVDSF
jgi:Tfp pilus assembly protein FimT